MLQKRTLHRFPQPNIGIKKCRKKRLVVPFSITLDSSISVFRQIIRDCPGIFEDFEKMAIFSPIFQLF